MHSFHVFQFIITREERKRSEAVDYIEATAIIYLIDGWNEAILGWRVCGHHNAIRCFLASLTDYCKMNISSKKINDLEKHLPDRWTLRGRTHRGTIKIQNILTSSTQQNPPGSCDQIDVNETCSIAHKAAFIQKFEETKVISDTRTFSV